RRLGLTDAVTIGLGSMIGAGIFVVFAPAAASAGAWLPLALVLAAVDRTDSDYAHLPRVDIA
ncbi:hypothetical protein RA276_31655, partial [Pseudomonas syringae pv. tagetis]